MPKISKKGKKSLLIIVFSLILVICAVVANYFSLLLVKTENLSSSLSSPSFDIYLLSSAKSQVKNEALTSSPDFQKNNEGGYVWENDNYYHVISSAYLNKNDAILVQNSIASNNTKSEIITINFQSYILLGNFDNDENKILTKALSCPIDFYKEIFDIAISLDTAVYNEISARMAVNNYHNTLSSLVDNFILLFENVNNDNITKLGELLQNMKSVSQKLCSGILLNNNQTYSSLLKYRYMEVLEMFYKFLNN